MAFCVGCGDALSDDSQFCASCGRPVDEGMPGGSTQPTLATPTVGVPDWVGAGWGTAVGWAFGAALIGLALMAVISLVLVVGLTLSLAGNDVGLGHIDWGEQLKNPFFLWLGLHGAFPDVPMWLTAIGWILVAFMLGARFGLGKGVVSDGVPSPAISAAILAAKTALVYAGVVLLAMIMFSPEATTVNERFIGLGTGYLDWEFGGAFFSSLFVSFAAAWGIRWWVTRSSRSAPAPGSVLELLAAAASGTWRILVVAVFGLLAFGFVGFAIELLGANLGVLDWFGNVLMTFVVAMGLLVGLDIGMAMFASAMQFFQGDSLVSEAVLGDPTWVIAGTVIVAVAFLWGGHRAARRTGSDVLSRIVQASALAGIGVTAAFVVASIIMGRVMPEMETGIGLSLLWTIVAVGGGLIYAQSVGALQTVLPDSAASGATGYDGGKVCGTCSTALPADAKFCASCGSTIA